MRVAGVPSEGLRPKHWREFARADSPAFDFVIALYDPLLGEPIPQLPGSPMTALWRYSDPCVAEGEDWQRRKAYGEVLSGLERQLRIFMQLPFASLDRMSLQERVERAGKRD